MAKNKKTHPLITDLANRHFASISDSLLRESSQGKTGELPSEKDAQFYESVQRAWFRHRVKSTLSLICSLLLIAAFLFTCWYLPYSWSRVKPQENDLPIYYNENRVNTKYVDGNGFIYYSMEENSDHLSVPDQGEYTPITIGDCSGYYLSDEDQACLVWFLEDKKLIMKLESDYLSKEELIYLAENLTQQARE